MTDLFTLVASPLIHPNGTLWGGVGVGQPERDKRRWEVVRSPGTSNPTNQVNHPPGCGPSRPKSLHRLHTPLHGPRETAEGTETKRDRKWRWWLTHVISGQGRMIAPSSWPAWATETLLVWKKRVREQDAGPSL